MRKVFTLVVTFIFFQAAFSQQEEPVNRAAFIDSAVKLIKMVGYKGYTVAKFGTRVVLTKTDSIYIATSYSDFKPDRPTKDFAAIKYQYQLFIDFTDKEFDFNRNLHKTVNDSIDKVIRSFSRKKYEKGEYFTHLEAVELLEKMKIKDNPTINNFDIRFTDNLAPGWIPYDWNDVKYFPVEPPTRLQKTLEDMKRKIMEMLEEWGI